MRKNSIRILFLFMALFLVFVLKSDVKAMTFTYNETEYTVPDLPENCENFTSEYYTIFPLSRANRYQLVSYINFNPNTMRVFTTNSASDQGSRFGVMSVNGSTKEAEDEGVIIRLWSCAYDGAEWTLDDWQPRYIYGLLCRLLRHQ